MLNKEKRKRIITYLHEKLSLIWKKKENKCFIEDDMTKRKMNSEIGNHTLWMMKESEYKENNDDIQTICSDNIMETDSRDRSSSLMSHESIDTIFPTTKSSSNHLILSLSFQRIMKTDDKSPLSPIETLATPPLQPSAIAPPPPPPSQSSSQIIGLYEFFEDSDQSENEDESDNEDNQGIISPSSPSASAASSPRSASSSSSLSFQFKELTLHARSTSNEIISLSDSGLESCNSRNYSYHEDWEMVLMEGEGQGEAGGEGEEEVKEMENKSILKNFEHDEE